MRKLLKAFVRDERGVSAMEYAIMAGIVAVALTAVGTAFSTNIQTLFTNLYTKITAASAS
ncbi:Flp family type IVb pilin [Paraburkholderia sp. A1RI_3L]|uniref:Flp family type IVb pilin n=1 Tax=Paraburkholderia TaxID=1822464 RepID=UPI003B7A1954